LFHVIQFPRMSIDHYQDVLGLSLSLFTSMSDHKHCWYFDWIFALLHAGLGKADPYAIITCGAQAHKSLIAKGNNVSTARNLQLRGPPAASLLDCKQFQSCLYNGFLQIEELAACICHTFGYLQSHKRASPLFSCLVFSWILIGGFPQQNKCISKVLAFLWRSSSAQFKIFWLCLHLMQIKAQTPSGIKPSSSTSWTTA
jgi:hypothetical protein